ncbi:MAG: diguanylate cyclase [Denitromonas halophila]|nr:MAG: diguanylate cyclase [Denitromonas halophila]
MSDTPPNKELSDELARIRDQFVASLPGQIDHLRTALADLAGTLGHARDDALRQAHVTAHSLAGTAGTFGFPALGSAARILEYSLRDALAGDEGDQSERRYQSLLDSLIYQANAATDDTPSPHSASALPPRPFTHAGLVVLVEDDPALANRLSSYLHHFGYEVLHFESATAFAAAASEMAPPAALLLDNALPEGPLAGVDIANALPANLRATPLLFMSANDSQEARIGALRAGCLAYLLKPIEPAQVLDALEGITQRESDRPIRVMIVDDEPAMVAHHCAVLNASGFDTVSLSDPGLLLDMMRDQLPDIVLLDLHMPEYSGRELAALIHQIPSFAGIPVLFISSERDFDTQQAAMQSGGDDFLVKPVGAERLVNAVRYRATRHRQLRDLMKNDSLTGLLNHANIKSRLAAEMHRIDRHGGNLTLAMVDVDRFKQVNDEHGHVNGDRILRELAMLLRRRLRSSDEVGRYGGEEFLVLLPNTSAAAAVELLNAIREDFFQIAHFIGDTELHVSFSGGIASQDDWNSPEALLMAADAALYSAKKSGRNRIVLSPGTR